MGPSNRAIIKGCSTFSTFSFAQARRRFSDPNCEYPSVLRRLLEAEMDERASTAATKAGHVTQSPEPKEAGAAGQGQQEHEAPSLEQQRKLAKIDIDAWEPVLTLAFERAV